MARITFESRNLVLATQELSPEKINAALAQFARQSLRTVIADGSGTDRYDRYVNGVPGADESTVKAPGPILYRFQWWADLIPFALKTLIERSPERTGRYKSSWFVMVNGVRTADYENIPGGASVTIVNDQPYSRKIDTGFMVMRVPPHVVEDSVKVVMQRFGNLVKARRTMIRLPNPYILKGVFKKGIRKHSRTKLRRDTSAGAEMTYPAMIIELRA